MPLLALPALPAAALERLVHMPSRGRRRDKLNRLLQAAEVGRLAAQLGYLPAQVQHHGMQLLCHLNVLLS
jgi:integrase